MTISNKNSDKEDSDMARLNSMPEPMRSHLADCRASDDAALKLNGKFLLVTMDQASS